MKNGKDTVGFIQKLATTLVPAFRVTLEEIAEFSILVHVVDISDNPLAEQQIEAVEKVLLQLDMVDKAGDIEKIKMEAKSRNDVVCVSALTVEGFDCDGQSFSMQWYDIYIKLAWLRELNQLGIEVWLSP